MKKMTISILLTVLMWGAGVYGFFFIKDYVPKQLSAPSTLIVEAKDSEDEQEVPLETKEIIHQVQKLVVKIELPNGSLGSGFLYNDKGDVITNAHVVANAEDVIVRTSDSKEYSGKVIGISSKTDVALVRVPGLEGTAPLEIANDRKAEIGDEVLALGSPLGLQNTVTTGIISGVDRDFEIDPFKYEDVYQISAPIAPGNSGGPLIDSQTGEVLGINSATMSQGSIGFSIPIVNVLAMIDGWSGTPMTAIPAISMSAEGTVSENVDAYLLEDYASYLVNYFYENLNYGDYLTAYALLGSSWQSNTSYEQFRKGYLHTLSVSIESISSIADGETSTVTIIISAQERKDDSTVLSKYQVSYKIGYENDQLKILSGTGEKIE